MTEGEFLGGNGGTYDAGIDELNTHYAQLPFHARAHVDPVEERAAAAVRWTGNHVHRTFSNPSTYPPIGYLPQAAGIVVGRVAGLTVMHTLILSRMLNGASALALSTLALCWCRRGRLVLFTLLLMPMAMSLFGSCNQDASLISATALAFALISRQSELTVPLSTSKTWLLATLLLIVLLERPAYAPFLLVLLIPGLLPRWRQKPSWITAIGLASSLMALTLAWWIPAFASTGNPAQPSGNLSVDARKQLVNVAHDPGVIPALLGDTAANLPEDLVEMIGVLGWIDTRMPLSYYLAMLLSLLLAAAGEAAYCGNAKGIAPAIVLAAAALAWIGVYGIEYLVWTPVGLRTVYGVQGRYFIPLAIAAAIGIPCVLASRRTYRWAAIAALLSPIVTIVYLPGAILARYYGR